MSPCIVDGKLLYPSSVLVKPVSARCNCACEYCFYMRPTDPYQGVKTHCMTDEVLRSFLRQHLQNAPGQVVFSWQGGEPLLAGIEFYRSVVRYQMLYGRDGQVVGNGFQTNATMITDEWAALFRNFNFLVGVSLDGPEDIHGTYRHYRDGRNTFSDVMRSIDVLRKWNVEFNVLVVVSDVSMTQAERIIDFFLREGITYLQFIPCVETMPDGSLKPFSVTPEGFGEFLKTAFDLWYDEPTPRFSERVFENLVARAAGFEHEVCELAETCGSYFVVEHNGDVYPCDFHVRKELLLGNLMQQPLKEIATSKKAYAFAIAKQHNTPECDGCEWLSICNRGCPRLRIRPGAKSYLCESYKMLFEHAESRIKRLARILRRRMEPRSRRGRKR